MDFEVDHLNNPEEIEANREGVEALAHVFYEIIADTYEFDKQYPISLELVEDRDEYSVLLAGFYRQKEKIQQMIPAQLKSSVDGVCPAVNDLLSLSEKMMEFVARRSFYHGVMHGKGYLPAPLPQMYGLVSWDEQG